MYIDWFLSFILSFFFPSLSFDFNFCTKLMLLSMNMTSNCGTYLCGALTLFV